MDINNLDFKSNALAHFGIVSGVIDELGLVEKIDKLLPIEGNSKLSMGNRVKGMLLSGLGFTNYRLYMSEHFFKDKALHKLFDCEIDSSCFNDDALGRCLDKIYEYGTSSFYAQLAFSVAKEQNLLDSGYRHDSTSMSVFGDYEYFNNNEGLDITYGFSKDHRSDLKQVNLLLTMTKNSSFPLWISGLNGNSNDKTAFHEVDKKFREFRRQLKLADSPLVVGDSALYSSELLERTNKEIDLYWLTRVPESIKEAKDLCSKTVNETDWNHLDNGYKYHLHTSNRGEVEQRWLLFYSQKAFDKEIATFQKQITKDKDSCEKSLTNFKEFACEADANEYISKITKKWKYHSLEYTLIPITKHKSKGRPKPGTVAEVVGYKVSGRVVENAVEIGKAKNSRGRFILATNQLDKTTLPDNMILSEYKGQASIEKGFRFLKDPWFMVSSLFLKKNTRIEALMSIMTLCLMVYNIAERKMRQELKKNGNQIPLQNKKLSDKPSLKWAFQLMQDIAVLSFMNIPGTTNNILKMTTLDDVHKKIISFFGGNVKKIYEINDKLRT
jgi:transposase